MAKLEVPEFVNDPVKVQKFGQWWMEKYYMYYPPAKLETKPYQYDIEFASVQGINESFILTKWGFAINAAVFTDLYMKDFSTWNSKDGIYYPAHWNGNKGVVLPIHNMRDNERKKNTVHHYSYKHLCDLYLKSTRSGLSDLLPDNKFW
jgi:hypothetical protein